ncbi:MAG TPA: hypothetical protein VGQ96_01610, partial [Candidatus Eremiobacteraceae bacterium]|nr:hypothetical protein [Candidatus Eremiobacteraceae bacterium]
FGRRPDDRRQRARGCALGRRRESDTWPGNDSGDVLQWSGPVAAAFRGNAVRPVRAAAGSISAGSVKVAATAKSSIFNLEQNNGDTKMAVYRGTVSAATPDHTTTLRAGAAAASAPGTEVRSIPLASIQEDFAALNCPDASVVNSVLPQPTAQP